MKKVPGNGFPEVDCASARRSYVPQNKKEKTGYTGYLLWYLARTRYMISFMREEARATSLFCEEGAKLWNISTVA